MRFPDPTSSLLALCASIFLISCSGGGGSGGGGSSSATTDNSVSGTLVVKRQFGELRQSVTGPPPGDGIWNYSVATDYYWGSVKGGVQPSLKADFVANNLGQKITYAFPVFGYIDQDATKGFSGNTVQPNCYIGKNTPIPSNQRDSLKMNPQAVFSYFAMPQLKPLFITGAYPAIGDCVDGAQATSYYKNTVGISRVVPVLEMSDDFNTAITYATNSKDPTKIDMDQLMDLAVTIANTILADDNAYGVAFDNEPAIFKATSTSTPKMANCQGLDLEAAFYGTIAHTLASGAKGPKYLFLYDAPDTARSLYKGVRYAVDPNGKQCPYSVNFPALTNIVMKPALYDLEVADSTYSSGPVSVGVYRDLVISYLKSTFALAGDPPAMVVLPASATDTMWSSLQSYNIGISSTPYVLPTTLKTPSTCNQDATVVGSVDYVAITSLICGDSSTYSCPDMQNPTTLPGTNVTNFLSMCKAYQNTSPTGANVVMNDYFSSALGVLNTNYIVGDGKSRYLGASLYAWRISAWSDLQGAISYYSLYRTPSALKTTSALFPMQITQDAWTSYLNWYSTTRPAQ